MNLNLSQKQIKEVKFKNTTYIQQCKWDLLHIRYQVHWQRK